jgi:hypothetical protein
MLLIAIINKGIESLNRLHQNVSASATTSTCGTTEFYVLLATKCDTTVPAIASLNKDFSLIQKFHCLAPSSRVP